MVIASKKKKVKGNFAKDLGAVSTGKAGSFTGKVERIEKGVGVDPQFFFKGKEVQPGEVNFNFRPPRPQQDIPPFIGPTRPFTPAGPGDLDFGRPSGQGLPPQQSLPEVLTRQQEVTQEGFGLPNLQDVGLAAGEVLSAFPAVGAGVLAAGGIKAGVGAIKGGAIGKAAGEIAPTIRNIQGGAARVNPIVKGIQKQAEEILRRGLPKDPAGRAFTREVRASELANIIPGVSKNQAIRMINSVEKWSKSKTLNFISAKPLLYTAGAVSGADAMLNWYVLDNVLEGAAFTINSVANGIEFQSMTLEEGQELFNAQDSLVKTANTKIIWSTRINPITWPFFKLLRQGAEFKTAKYELDKANLLAKVEAGPTIEQQAFDIRNQQLVNENQPQELTQGEIFGAQSKASPRDLFPNQKEL